mgnify:CR=1 FL=1
MQRVLGVLLCVVGTPLFTRLHRKYAEVPDWYCSALRRYFFPEKTLEETANQMRKPVLGQWDFQGSRENNFMALEPTMQWPENAIENAVYDPDDADPARKRTAVAGPVRACKQHTVSTTGRLPLSLAGRAVAW